MNATLNFNDGNGNLTRIDRDNADAADNVQSASFSYDGRNQLKTVVDGLGNETEHFYDDNGNRRGTDDAEDNATTILYDERNLVYSVTQPLAGGLSQVTTFDYDANGNVAEVVDGEQRTTGYDYDDYDRLGTVTHAATASHAVTTEVFAYDANGNLDTKTTRAGALFDFAFDARNRLIDRITPEETHHFEYDLGGRLVLASNSAITLTFGYNARDDLESEAVTALAGFPGVLPLAIGSEYDGAGNLTQVTHSDTEAFVYVPDAMNRLARIEDAAMTPLVTNAYDDLSLLDLRSFASGVSGKCDFDDASRIGAIRIRDAQQATLRLLDYTVQPNGWIDQIADASGGVVDYGYDPSGQLTQAIYPAGHLADANDTSLSYDLASNREDVTEGAGPAVPYVTNALNQYADTGAGTRMHDADGNLTDDGNRGLTWDSENRLTQATADTTVTTYAYDPFMRRVHKSVDNGSTVEDRWYLW